MSRDRLRSRWGSGRVWGNLRALLPQSTCPDPLRRVRIAGLSALVVGLLVIASKTAGRQRVADRAKAIFSAAQLISWDFAAGQKLTAK
jgi:hypothetical protein